MPAKKPLVRLTDEQRALAATCVRLAFGEGLAASKRKDPRFRLHIEASEAIGIAFVGLARAAQCYKPELGVKFTTYATVSIRNEITKELERRSAKKRQCPPMNSLYKKNGRLREDVCAPPFHAVETADSIERLKRELALLPAHEQFAVSRWANGDRFLDIAAVIGKSPQRAHQLVKSGIEKLKKRMRRPTNAIHR